MGILIARTYCIILPSKFLSDPNHLSSDCLPRWGARIGQTLTATDPSVKVSCKEYQWVDDILSPHNDGKMPYTDGCGTISPDLAREIWEHERGRRPVNRPQHEINVPKVFQIRLGPAKGVVSVDYRLKGRVSDCTI